ncbi:Cell cycle checkpoint protein RAD1 [Mycena sanguinolenta]|uniref:Cell cycle checkpoint protein RAD1 n=1 Tax=Mycena sanguinolenta TaxID=230812 RepID=A0A8H7D4L9_9AGAR|nr:Cell cycle checkpoint protein RAD1 [Mycena sanguinolenta]
MAQNEDESEEANLPPVLKASVHDVRYFATLLRGVNFVNRATVTIARSGFIVVVEEARTLLGTAYIFAHVFDEYTYNSETATAPQDSQNSDPDEEDNVAFEIPLNTLIECLNIFGTAGSIGAVTGSSTGTYKKWKRSGDGSDQEGDDDDGHGRRTSSGTGGTRGIENYFGNASDKGTGMRMSYAGSGCPLTLLIAEDAAGPTTTCEITTYEPEPHLQLPFESERMVLKIILKSSWLRDALSELDPSCDKLTFIGNPPPAANGRQQPRTAGGTPMLRIQAVGTLGSTEMDYPNDRDVLETFECTRPVSFSYRFGHISRTLRALQSSTKTSLRIDDEGLLSLQFLMPSPTKIAADSQAFIEFRCLALDDELE